MGARREQVPRDSRLETTEKRDMAEGELFEHVDRCHMGTMRAVMRPLE